jgi:hypothetical protein
MPGNVTILLLSNGNTLRNLGRGGFATIRA